MGNENYCEQMKLEDPCYPGEAMRDWIDGRREVALPRGRAFRLIVCPQEGCEDCGQDQEDRRLQLKAAARMAPLCDFFIKYE